MKSLIIVGGLAAAGGLAYVLYQRTRTGAPLAGAGLGYVPSTECKAARVAAAVYGQTISDAQCALADKVDDTVGLGALWNWVTGGDSWAEKDAANKAKNGPVALELSEAVRNLTGIRGVSASKVVVEPLLRGSVLRFANGGVPFGQHPDFSKCAPGTNDMTQPGAGANRFWLLPPFKRPTAAQIDAVVKNQTGDLVADAARWAAIGVDFRGPNKEPRISDMFRGSSTDPTTSVPASIVAGVPFRCDSGVLLEVIPVTDNREGASTEFGGRTIIKRCGVPGSAPVAAPPAVSDGARPQVSYTAPPGAPPPGFHWVQAVGSVPAHWERNAV
jgi:hypothetical protein